MTANPWRYRCPDGHANIYLYTRRFRCQTCRTTYSKDVLTDLAD